MGLPWQPAGYQSVGLAWSPWNATAPVNASEVLAVDGLAFYSLGYGIYQRHWMVAFGATYPLPGQVCSAALSAIAGRNYAFLAFCNATFLSFVDLGVGVPPRRLIGAATRGYAEGFRDAALFGAELYVAVDGSGAGLYVSDALNCAIRRVAIPTYPGDFLTRSYLVYGDTAGTCDVDSGAILSPGPLFPVSVAGYLFYIFAATGGLYQLDDATLNVAPVATSWPSWVPDLSLLVRVDALNASALALRFAGSAAIVAATYTPCPASYTSALGGRCTLFCSAATNYVDLATGACLPCFKRACLVGEGTVACAPNSPQTCAPCPPLDGRIYNTPGSCSLENTYFVGVCPEGMYLSAATFAGVRVCVQCPPLSATSGAGATSIDQCRCFDGATKTASGTCVVGQLYPLPTPTSCPFRSYQRGAYEQCTSCRVPPFADCAVGFFPLDNGTCSACVKPLLSNFTTNGKSPNADTSCGYACLAGYYLDAAASFAVSSCLFYEKGLTNAWQTQDQCRPCTNAPPVTYIAPGVGSQAYAVSNGQGPSGCFWACVSPFEIRSGVCVLCPLANPQNATLPCANPLLTVAATVAAGYGNVSGVGYAYYVFNQSGWLSLSVNATVDVLLVGGGGSGGPAGAGAAGGGGGAGQVLTATRLAVKWGNYTVTVGAAGGGASSAFGLKALGGGTGGASGVCGGAGASGGGSGSGTVSNSRCTNVGLAGNGGGVDTVGNMGGGGGGWQGAGNNSAACQPGVGGGGGNVNGWPVGSVAAGGGGGSGNASSCPAGASGAGYGSGGAGASGAGNYGMGWSGVVVVRYVSKACVCSS